MPNVWNRTLAYLGFAREAETGVKPAGFGVIPPRRDSPAWISQERALTLSTVFRAVQIHSTAVAQLSLDVTRNGDVIEKPALVTRPSLKLPGSAAFFEMVTSSLYLDGNAFLKLIKGPDGSVVDVDVLDPRLVHVASDPVTGRTTYGYGKKTDYTVEEIKHLKFLRVAGFDRGLGPIQAARIEIAGALDARDYGAGWFSESAMPSGILKTDQPLSGEEAATYKNIWNGVDDEGNRLEGTGTHGTRVLGAGLSYEPLLLKPADVQFLETQQFTTTQIARLMGVPASLLLAAVEGNSQTYSNVEQDWIGYIRFSLMKTLLEIESVFTDLLPRGQRARFNIDALLRTDTKTRYEAHKLALDGGWKTDDEIRATEGLPPLTTEQRDQIKAKAKAPAAIAPKEAPVA